MNNPNPQSLRGTHGRPRESRTRKSQTRQVPHQVRRRLVPIKAGIGFAGAAIKSLTLGIECKYHPVVCLESGAVRCECDDFRYRHAPHEPSLHTPEHWCKHLVRLIRNLQRLGELPRYLEAEARPCSCCGEFGAQFRRAERDAQNQWICALCVESAKRAYNELPIGQALAKEEANALAVEMYLWRHRSPTGLCPCCQVPESACECAEWQEQADDPQLYQANKQCEIDRAALRAGCSWEEVYGPNWQRIKAYMETL